MDDEEMAMMVRKFRKFFRKKGGFQKGDSSQRKGYKKEKAPVCLECKKPGHFKAECPSLQRSKGKDKRKAFVSSDRKSTRLNSSHSGESRMPSSA